MIPLGDAGRAAPGRRHTLKSLSYSAWVCSAKSEPMGCGPMPIRSPVGSGLIDGVQFTRWAL